MNIKKWRFRFGIAIILISILVFFMLFSIPFLTMDVKSKLTISPILLVVGEVMFWLGIVLIGKDVYLNFKSKMLKGKFGVEKTNNSNENEQT